MAAPSRKQSQEQDTRDSGQRAVYVYGILPGDVELEPGTTGVGDPPAEVRLVRHGDLAALVSDVEPNMPLGRPDDLIAHEELLDSVAAEVPVLPVRFGAVMTGDDAVAEELLDTRDEFTAALDQLEGHAEYIVRGRYVEEAILHEALTEDPRAARLRDQIRNADPDATRNQRIQLGEIINNAIAAKREADTRAVGDALADFAAASVVREPTHELDAVYVAFLVESRRREDLEKAVRRLARDWRDRVELRLTGPLAVYDFADDVIAASSGSQTADSASAAS
jgi:Gas vesicle synthesis protein GvpL/GvpF